MHSNFMQHVLYATQAALDHSLLIKRTEAGLKTLALWGRIIALNGKVRRIWSY
jgi:hypothetical protein